MAETPVLQINALGAHRILLWKAEPRIRRPDRAARESQHEHQPKQAAQPNRQARQGMRSAEIAASTPAHQLQPPLLVTRTEIVPLLDAPKLSLTE